MNTVKVKREELLTKVRSNRDAHRTLFLKAQEGYRKLVIEELDRMLADAKAGGPIARSINLVGTVRSHRGLRPGTGHARDECGRHGHLRCRRIQPVRSGPLDLEQVRNFH